MISNLIIYIAQPYDLNLFVSLASRSYMLCSVAAFSYTVINCFRQYVPYKTMQILTIVFMVGFALVSHLLSDSGGTYLFIIRLLCYLALPIYFLYLDYLKPDKWMLHFIFILNFLASVVFGLLSFSSLSYAGYENYIGTSSAWMTLGYENPNQTAMYLLINQVVLLCAFYYYSKKPIRLILLADALFMGWLILKTSSRTCIGISALILAVCIFRRKYRIKKYVVAGILILPLLFFIIYPYLFDNTLFVGVVIGGKTDYSARGEFFKTAITAVGDRFLFGDFGRFQLQNLHNGPLSIYASVGVIGLAFFYVYYYRAYYRMLYYGFQCKAAFLAAVGLLSVFLHACTESGFITGGAMYAGSLSALILLTKMEGCERH